MNAPEEIAEVSGQERFLAGFFVRGQRTIRTRNFNNTSTSCRLSCMTSKPEVESAGLGSHRV
jgi:hypothetical protein